MDVGWTGVQVETEVEEEASTGPVCIAVRLLKRLGGGSGTVARR